MRRTIRRAILIGRRCGCTWAAATLIFGVTPDPASAQKTDTVIVRSGGRFVGEIKGLQRGQLQYSTDAMGTVYVEWPKVRTVITTKVFDISLENGTIYFGSLKEGGPDSVTIVAADRTVPIPTQSIVALQRIKPTFWDALDGNLNVGFDFTQQNAKVDLSMSGEVRYAAQKRRDTGDRILATEGITLTKLTVSSSFSRQDSVANIERLQATLSRSRQLKSRWFWILSVSGSRNSQLSLDYRLSVGAGAGRALVQSNRLDLGVWVGPAYSLEQFTGEDPDSSIPLVLAAGGDYFTWGTLDTTLSGDVQVMPILNQWGRWRVNFTLNANRELLHNFYLNVGITEAYDSDPTAADADKNDFSLTTSIGLTF